MSAFFHLLQDHGALRSIRFDQDRNQFVVAGTRTELNEVASNAGEVAAGLANGVSAIGSLLYAADYTTKGVPDETIEQVGRLLSELGDALHGLVLLATESRDALASDEVSTAPEEPKS